MDITLTVNGEAQSGMAVPLLLAASGLGGCAYVVGTSWGVGPIDIGNQMLELSLDPLLMATVGGAPGFAGYMGLLDPAGRASAAIALPDLPMLRGLTLCTAYVVVDLQGPLPLRGTSDTLRLGVQ